MKRITMLLGAGILLLSSIVYAAVPQLINFQGILKDGSGNPVADGSYFVTFRIYDVPSGGSAVWSDTQTVITSSGLFNAILGRGTPVSDSVFKDTVRYLGIGVFPDGEMSPRQRLGSVGYAFESAQWTSAAQDLFRLNGNVGIGTNAPGAVLHVAGNAGTLRLEGSDHTFIEFFPDGPATRKAYFGFAGAAINDVFVSNEISTGHVILLPGSSGNVGIGTVNPETKLHVSGSAEGLRIQGTGVGGPGGAYASFYDEAGTGIGYVGDGSSSDQDMYVTSYLGNVYLYTPAGAVLTATSTGRVGIGTTAPASGKLHVDGGGATAVYGTTTGSGTGVWGNSPDFVGVRGTSVTNNGVYGSSSSGNAGRFDGDVEVNGTLTKTAGSFKIDHPLHPANQYLYHSFVESPDMKNIYDGVVTTDAKGNATVSLDEWFGALNRDFRYQLTVIGQFAQAIVSKKIENNQFFIKTDKPNVEVSWQVTGIRKDAYANAHRIPVEEVKLDKERGFYIHPELFGQPEEKGTEWANYPEMMKQLKEQREKAKADK